MTDIETEGRARRNRAAGLAIRLLLAAAGALAPALGAIAAEPSAVLRELECGNCHRLEPRPAKEATLAEYAARKAPDLFYAGSKYRPEWLRAWLASPTPIRPAGLHPAERTRSTPEGDVLVDEPAPAHPAVPKARLDDVVAALEKLDWGRDRLAAAPKKAAIPRALAELNFVKFKGCGSCHRTSPSAPPASGPDVIDAYRRLRPEFLASYLADPQAWDPVAPMPGYGLAEADVAKLVEYLRLVAEEDHAKAR